MELLLPLLMRRACCLQCSFGHPVSLPFWKGSAQSYEQKSSVASHVYSGLKEDLPIESCAAFPVTK